MHWILWQILAVMSIITYITIGKVFGQNSFIEGHLYFCAAVMALGWSVPIAYAKAPSFIQAQTIQSGLLPVAGLLVGVLFFKECPSRLNYMGILLILIGILFVVDK